MSSLSRIWDGDVTRVRVARKAYAANPSLETFIPLLSALYSFRFLPWYARELDELLWSSECLDYRVELLNTDAIAKSTRARQIADRCDVFCTVFEWQSRKWPGARHIAKDFYKHGIQYAAQFVDDPAHAHTFCLLGVRYARILLARKERVRARVTLGGVVQVASPASAIANPNQRSRIYAQLGLLLPKVMDKGDSHCVHLGSQYASMATSISGIGKMTRLKSWLAAWGIDF